MGVTNYKAGSRGSAAGSASGQKIEKVEFLKYLNDPSVFYKLFENPENLKRAAEVVNALTPSEADQLFNEYTYGWYNFNAGLLNISIKDPRHGEEFHNILAAFYAKCNGVIKKKEFGILLNDTLKIVKHLMDKAAWPLLNELLLRIECNGSEYEEMVTHYDSIMKSRNGAEQEKGRAEFHDTLLLLCQHAIRIDSNRTVLLRLLNQVFNQNNYSIINLSKKIDGKHLIQNTSADSCTVYNFPPQKRGATLPLKDQFDRCTVIDQVYLYGMLTSEEKEELFSQATPGDAPYYVKLFNRIFEIKFPYFLNVSPDWSGASGLDEHIEDPHLKREIFSALINSGRLTTFHNILLSVKPATAARILSFLDENTLSILKNQSPTTYEVLNKLSSDEFITFLTNFNKNIMITLGLRNYHLLLMKFPYTLITDRNQTKSLSEYFNEEAACRANVLFGALKDEGIQILFDWFANNPSELDSIVLNMFMTHSAFKMQVLNATSLKPHFVHTSLSGDLALAWKLLNSIGDTELLDFVSNFQGQKVPVMEELIATIAYGADIRKLGPLTQTNLSANGAVSDRITASGRTTHWRIGNESFTKIEWSFQYSFPVYDSKNGWQISTPLRTVVTDDSWSTYDGAVLQFSKAGDEYIELKLKDFYRRFFLEKLKAFMPHFEGQLSWIMNIDLIFNLIIGICVHGDKETLDFILKHTSKTIRAEIKTKVDNLSPSTQKNFEAAVIEKFRDEETRLLLESVSEPIKPSHPLPVEAIAPPDLPLPVGVVAPHHVALPTAPPLDPDLLAGDHFDPSQLNDAPPPYSAPPESARRSLAEYSFDDSENDPEELQKEIVRLRAENEELGDENQEHLAALRPFRDKAPMGTADKVKALEATVADLSQQVASLVQRMDAQAQPAQAIIVPIEVAEPRQQVPVDESALTRGTSRALRFLMQGGRNLDPSQCEPISRPPRKISLE